MDQSRMRVGLGSMVGSSSPVSGHRGEKDITMPAFSHLRSLVTLRKFCFAAIAVGLVAIWVDYLFAGVDLNAVLAGDAHTNPITAVALVLGFLATLSQRPLKVASRTETRLWLGVCACVLVYPALESAGLMAWLGVAHPGRMGINTAISLLLIALGQLLRARMSGAAFVCALLSLISPFISVNGYILGHSEFFGEMALTTTLVLLPLSLANLVRFARRRALA
ncbi:hypothetical protein [Aestuariicoccus sp. MJ-SS9]|uniref:hypothetical protein n=1 Tax=Aestuariicoccus sp. MJ-SS9 TaxID=3079855 RepID=UPI002912848A|nr:hypothetical protein [Aestuariicoccus sp. MJ-SS9]MDU8912668.1 hypothetical protein [Aestuariicoccus sp. MJ-SS9]